MSETEVIESSEIPNPPIQERFKIENRDAILHTIIATLFGALIYLVLETLPMPYLSFSILPLGILPSIAVITTIGAIRGPTAGLLSGYFGVLFSNIVLNGEIVALSLYGLAIGVSGFVVGLGKYDFFNGRSLAKLSIMSVIGVVFTALLTAVFGIFVEGVATLVVIAFQLLPILSLGIPSVILLTPLFARIWCWLIHKFTSPVDE